MTPGTYCVIIPTLNAENEIGNLLNIVLSQDPAPLDVLVVDSSSDDATCAVVRSFDKVRLYVIERKDFDHGGTRHDALMRTSGEFVCFLTQDAVPVGSDYFAKLLEPFRDHTVAMVSGRQLPKQDARPFERLVRGYNYPEESFVRTRADVTRLGIKAFYASDVCSAYRRSAYLSVGGFEHPLNTNEDMLIASRFLMEGMKVAYAADAQVLHSHNLTPRQQYERNRQVGIFLETHMDDFAGLSEVGEGGRLVISVAKQLIAERRPLELVAFGVDCTARFLGNRFGRRTVRKAMRSGIDEVGVAGNTHKKTKIYEFDAASRCTAKPIVSVCMATYNGENFLCEQMDSILACLGLGDEVIVSDDGSTDATLDILEVYARTDNRIHVFNGPRKGVIQNFSHAISLASGEYIFLSDQDDVWRDDKVKRVLEAFNEFECDLVVHNARIIDESGLATDKSLYDIRASRKGFVKNIVKNSYVGCCMAFRRSLIPFVLPIPSGVEMHDWWIGLSCELHAKSYFIEDELIGYRRHSGNVSSMSHHALPKMIANRALLVYELARRSLSIGKG